MIPNLQIVNRMPNNIFLKYTKVYYIGILKDYFHLDLINILI